MSEYAGSSSVGAESTAHTEADSNRLIKSDWSPLSTAEILATRDDERINQINNFPRTRRMSPEPGKENEGEVTSDAAAVAAAHYCFELATGLVPFPALFTYREAGKSEEEIEKFKESQAVTRELVTASKLYAALRIDRHIHGGELIKLQSNINTYTRDYNETNNGALRVLKTLIRHHVSRPELDKGIERDAEYLIRMIIAKNLGKISQYDDLQNIIFEDEDAPKSVQ